MFFDWPDEQLHGKCSGYIVECVFLEPTYLICNLCKQALLFSSQMTSNTHLLQLYNLVLLLNGGLVSALRVSTTCFAYLADVRA